MRWDAGLYLKFASERTQPSLDLIRRIQIENPRRIIDIGCGPGNSTEPLWKQWPEATVAGLDRSPEMIEAARKTYPERTWLLGDVHSWKADEPFDLIFSNATLQWVSDHETVCRRIFDQVAPGGALAVQMPAHYESPLHGEIVEVSRDPAWNARMEGARNALTKHPASFYYDLLGPIASRMDLWETIYYHIVAGPEAVLDWFRGTGFRPYLEALRSDEERQQFEALLLDRYKRSYPPRPSGKVLFPFRRLFFIAYR
ncbi:MAG: methyltransferase domain-containing protein [Bryobacteraceae bacterium]|jgi:trans-aconitate 2-methyltransferase